MTFESDIVIIGSGIYGYWTAKTILENDSQVSVIMVERTRDLFKGASQMNQVRLHNGFHYASDIATLQESAQHYQSFLETFPDYLFLDLPMIYAVGLGSTIDYDNYVRILNQHGLKFKEFNPSGTYLEQLEMYEGSLLEVDEKIIYHTKWRNYFVNKMKDMAIKYKDRFRIVTNQVFHFEDFKANVIFNCTYGRINDLHRFYGIKPFPITLEIAEMFELEIRPQYLKWGVTYVDGRFPSLMPIVPDITSHAWKAGLLSHVRYTPYKVWQENDLHPESKNLAYTRDFCKRRAKVMCDASSAFIPWVKDAPLISTWCEVKAKPMDKGKANRQVMMEANWDGIKNYHVICGGKLSTVFLIEPFIKKALDNM